MKSVTTQFSTGNVSFMSSDTGSQHEWLMYMIPFTTSCKQIYMRACMTLFSKIIVKENLRLILEIWLTNNLLQLY